MSIEVRFFPDDQEIPAKVYYPVEPGSYEGFRDISAGQFIVAHCFEEDCGGAVYLADIPEDAPAVYDQERPISVAVVSEAEKILPGFSIKKNIVDSDGDSGELFIQHVMPDGTINSLN